MKKEVALRELARHLDEYASENKFIYHIKFIEELRALLFKNAKGNEKSVFSILVKQLGFVKTQGKMVYQADSNEILSGIGGERDYYSLHIENSIVNFRLLMTFSEEGNPIFLACFFEKSGKKVSSYANWIPVLEQRYNEIMEKKDE